MDDVKREYKSLIARKNELTTEQRVKMREDIKQEINKFRDLIKEKSGTLEIMRSNYRSAIDYRNSILYTTGIN